LTQELDAIPEQYLKKLASEIWECRIQFGGNIFRVLCFFDGVEVVLTYGFQKKPERPQELRSRKQKVINAFTWTGEKNERFAKVYRKTKKERL
jgi:hypothetical protein